VLFLLSERDEQPVSELARELRISPAAATGLIDRIEEQGFVRRSGTPSDRRQVRVSLTDEGRLVIDEIWTASTPLREALHALGAERLTLLTELLTELIRHLPLADDG
jgi:DNA-binding MarR family transcriptional regulator